MREGDLIINEGSSKVEIAVFGRANFTYAVPLRELADRLNDLADVQMELSGCETMDSTFMGVITMMGLKLFKAGKRMELRNASDHVQKLLRGLGVAKLFNYVTGAVNAEGIAVSGNATTLQTAGTVVDAHRTLVEANQDNAAKFDSVIEYAQQDLERLKKSNEN